MSITEAKYNKAGTSVVSSIDVTINGIKWSVPLDSNNADYAAIVEWAEIDGNTIVDAD
tara:strand:+ start:382 stop:555 length:174 start_codon:yes stop_codon:yes gene_type:complete